jgi:hypothetical protein
MTKDQEALEREFLAFHRGVAHGVAVVTGARALGDWGRRSGERATSAPGRSSAESRELAVAFVACEGPPEVVEQVARLLEYVEARTAQEIARWLLTQPSLQDASRQLAHGEWRHRPTKAAPRADSGPARPDREPT